MDTSRDELLRSIAEEIRVCTRCDLSRARKLAVPGEGPAHVEVMFIGEGPGFYENEQGRPFVGPAGHFLDELLARAGLKREDVFITNVVKCRPPGNRDPLPDELDACRDYLNRQIALLDPLVVVTLGRFSMAHFGINGKISAIHGQGRWIGGRYVVAMFHPAAALHQPALKSAVEEDFTRLPQSITLARREATAHRGAAEQGSSAEGGQGPEQLSLF